MPYPKLERHPSGLPIEDSSVRIATAVATGSLVLTAEPGAGKSSVVPQLVASEIDGRVLVLEPRRLAARATARRLSEMTVGCGGVGDIVGLTIRGEHRVSDRTRIEVVTEAILTARLQRDPELASVAAVVFDEFHERNLHSDLGLAMALESRATIRPDLCLVVMSATLDPRPVAALLDTEQILELPGRVYPVETRNLRRPSAKGWADAVAAAAREAAAEVAGDVLVFVPGRREIADVSRRLAGAEVIGLHGGSSSEVQNAVLRRGTRQRMIVATSVAETSVTLPGIEAVVDGGLLRRARFDPATGLGRLETVNVTRFAADQRRGRAGRVGPGICLRLWSKDDEHHLDDSVPPEIVDGDPLPVAFELARWGDPDARGLPLLDHPGVERLRAARNVLEQLELLTVDGSLTEGGMAASRLGLHPRLARLVLVASETDQLAQALPLVALLDSDRWPTSPDVLTELDRSRNDLKKEVARLRRRLDTRVRSRRTAKGASRAAGNTLGHLLAAAWPDRIAQQRPTRPDRYHLSSGREAALRSGSPLAGAEFLVVVEADGAGSAVDIRRAVALDRSTVLDAAAPHIEWVEDVRWDDRSDTVVARRLQRLGALVMHAEPLAAPDPAQISQALADGLARRGLDLLRWSEGANELRHRLAWLHASDPRWPAFSDEVLLDRLEEWLDLSSCVTPAQVMGLRITDQFLALLPWELRSELGEAAPVTLPLPAGGEKRLDYSTGRPVWSVRIQQIFGLDVHPTVGPNQEPVTIELLSPAQRPAQVTTDLPRFWRGSYAGVRAELRGRYPKHPWPEQPQNAPATHRTSHRK